MNASFEDMQDTLFATAKEIRNGHGQEIMPVAFLWTPLGMMQLALFSLPNAMWPDAIRRQMAYNTNALAVIVHSEAWLNTDMTLAIGAKMNGVSLADLPSSVEIFHSYLECNDGQWRDLIARIDTDGIMGEPRPSDPNEPRTGRMTGFFPRRQA